MESYPLSFTAARGNQNLPASGDLIVYESAVAAGETRLRVKPDNGGVVILRPGQWFRNPSPVTQWAVESYNKTDVIDAVFVIGYGEFGDANTLNKVTLDATFANVVTVAGVANTKVGNTVAERIPVTLDPTQTINTASNVMAYTASYSASAACVANTPIQMLAAATNVNGVVLNKFDMIYNTGGGAGIFSVIAKATAPTSQSDGDVLASGVLSSGATVKIGMDIAKEGQPKVAAGKAIWYFATVIDGAPLRDALFTVL